MTFSMLAFDPAARQMGVASASHYPGVGAVVTWAEAGTGVIATQAFAQPSYGPRGFAMLRVGESADAVLESLLADDDTPELRQVGVVDASGSIATYTGPRCVPAVGVATATHAVALGNTLEHESVPAVMLRAYQDAGGDLAHRLVAALTAGEEAGGDIRGRQSAALRVVGTGPTDTPWAHVVRDLRVDDHADPVAELGRLVDLYDTFDVVSRTVFDPRGVLLGDRADCGADAFAAAAAQLERADQALGGNPEASFWAAVVHARAGQGAQARRFVDHAARLNPRLPTLFRRLTDAGILTAAEVQAAEPLDRS
ncbi:DUF1028 domain-containing protein [Streptomyces sp. NPDC088387]|uniref:DUF1028 domain-containing protein n=1 Tax=Streptomyces sp. NPDC088387 TaxID=3365859 RepID=UPI0038214364